MAKQKIKVESLPSDLNGCQLEHEGTYAGKVSEINENGDIVQVNGLKVQLKMDTHIIEFRDPYVGNIIPLCEGCTFNLHLQDILGQVCPPMMCLGPITISKHVEYKLNYTDDPIEGWTIRDRSTKNSSPNAKQLCYPENIKTQKQLMELILSHEAIHRCAFANWHIEYPAEVQRQMDMDALETREKALAEKQALAKKQFEKDQALLKAEREKLEAKLKDSKGS